MEFKEILYHVVFKPNGLTLNCFESEFDAQQFIRKQVWDNWCDDGDLCIVPEEIETQS